MILAENRQQQQQPTTSSNSSDAVAIKLETLASTSQTQPEQRQLQKREDDVEAQKEGCNSRSVVAVDAEDSLARYQDQRNVSATINSGDETSDDTTSTSGSYTSTSDAEIEDAPIDQIEDRGWLTKVQPQSACVPSSVQHEMNGAVLPVGDPLQINGDISMKNVTNLHLGNRMFCKGPVTIVYKNTAAVNEEKSSLESGDEERLEKTTEGEGPKLSNGSSHPLYAFPHGRFAEWFWTKRCTITICVATLILALIIILCVVLLSGTDPPPNSSHSVSPNDSSINNEPTIPGVHIVPRVEWGAQPPNKPAEKLRVLPAIYVIISHTASTFCYTQAQCVLTVRVAQTFHIESKGWDDIAYNFLVGGDGLVYEGRGWDVEGAHTFNYNYKSIGISFIGTFQFEEPTKAQLYAAKKLIEYGVNNGHISKDYKLLGHRQCIKTESPGNVLYNILKTWDHWSPTP